MDGRYDADVQVSVICSVWQLDSGCIVWHSTALALSYQVSANDLCLPTVLVRCS